MHPYTAKPLQAQLREETYRLLEQAKPLFRQAGRASPEVHLRFDLRGQTAGQVVWQHKRPVHIRYNLAMAEMQLAAFMAETVPHEVAHVVVRSCHRGARPHGPEWRAVMHFFGIDRPTRCHQFTLPSGSARRQRRWPYRCACSEHQLSTTRHRRVQQAGNRYLCRCCGETLIYRPEAG